MLSCSVMMLPWSSVIAPSVSADPAGLSLASLLFFLLLPHVKLLDGIRLQWLVLVFALGLFFLLFFCFESQLPVEGECRVFEFLKSGRAVFSFKVLAPSSDMECS